MLDELSHAFFIIVNLFAIYFAVISLFGLVPLKRKKNTEKQLKFAVLIAARNEESCISGIVDSLKRQNYPEELCHIYVIPNNCTDNTEAAAISAGARIIRVSEMVASKGAALREATALLMGGGEAYDAFCVFDADNEADENFLSAMNQTLCAGANVAKSRILSKNRTQSWVCACYDIYFCTANLFMNRARARLGLSARLIGTGFAVKTEFLKGIGGFCATSITEDAEFYAICAAKGERIAFCEQALTYDEEPLSFRTSLTQRKRWMSGIMQVANLKFIDLLSGMLHKKSFFVCLDVLLQFFFAYFQALLPFAFLLSFWLAPVDTIQSIPLSLATAYFGAVANAVLVLVLQKRFDKTIIKGVLLYPIFVFSFIPLQTISLFKRTTVWHHIEHTGVKLESV